MMNYDPQMSVEELKEVLASYKVMMGSDIYLHDGELEYDNLNSKKIIQNILGERKSTCANTIFRRLCTCSQVSVFLLSSRIGNFPKKTEPDLFWNHSNLLIVRRKTKDIFIFEPEVYKKKDENIYLEYLRPNFVKICIKKIIKNCAPKSRWKIFCFNGRQRNDYSCLSHCMDFIKKLSTITNVDQFLNQEIMNKLRRLKKTKPRGEMRFI
jgi:hypothetical protein